MTRSGLLVTALLIACTAHGQPDNPVAAAIARDTDNLVIAAIARNLDAVERLLASGADVDQRWDGRTALEVAVGQRDVEIAQALIAAGADVNAPCCGGNALFAAARARDLAMVRVLLAADADPNRQGGINGDTALIYGIRQHSSRNPAPMEIARLLIEAGADVNLASKNGVTPLSLAVQGNDPESLAMVETLLARGANVDHRRCYYVPDSNARNRTPYTRVVGATALGLAASIGNTAAVEALIAAGADADLPQCDGKTPLELAMENGHEEVSGILQAAVAAQ